MNFADFLRTMKNMRFKYFFREILKGKTASRALLFAALTDLFEKEKWLNGNFSVLEIGGEPASHHRAFPKAWKITASNYLPKAGIEVIIDAGEKFPLKDGGFDGTVFFNVLYIIKNYENCLKESLRVSGKFIIFNSPLIAGIMSHPNDFNRFTEDRLCQILELLKKESVFEYRIIPLGGSFSSAANVLWPYLRFRIISVPVFSAAFFLDKLDKILKYRCPAQYLVLIKKNF